MDLTVIRKTQVDVGIQNSHNTENLKETEHNGLNNQLKTESDQNSFFQGVTNNNITSLEVGNSIFNYTSFKKAMDLRIHRRNDDVKRTIFDDADYFAKNHTYKLLPITFESVDETIIHIEHNYCHSYVSSESETDEYCSRTMDFTQIREKNYKRRRTKAPESPDEDEKDDNDQNDQNNLNIASFSSTLNYNCGSDSGKENSKEILISPPQPLDLSAHLVQGKKTDSLLKEHQHSILNFNNSNNNVEEKKGDIEFDSDKENLKSKLKCIEVTITGSEEKKNYQPCDLFLNDIARLVPKLVGKDCREVDILDRTCDRYVDVKKRRLYYIISESTWRLFKSTNERIILTNDQSLGELVEKKDSKGKPSFLVFDQYSLAKCLADYCKEAGGYFEYNFVEDNKEEATDTVEVVNEIQNKSKKGENQCNVSQKESEMTGTGLEIKMEYSPEKINMFRKDEMNLAEKCDIRHGFSVKNALVRSEEKLKCGTSKGKVTANDKCDVVDSFSSQTLNCEDKRNSREKESPKCGRRKCAPIKDDCPPPFAEKRVSWKKNPLKAMKRLKRNKCIAKRRRVCLDKKKSASCAPKKKACHVKKKRACAPKKKACHVKKKKACAPKKKVCHVKKKKTCAPKKKKACAPKKKKTCAPKKKKVCHVKKKKTCAPKKKKHCAPKKKKTCAPKKKACAPKKKVCAPKKKACAPKKKVCAPKKKACAPKKKVCAPKKKVCAPKKKVCAPKKKKHCAPKKKKVCPVKKKRSCHRRRKRVCRVKKKACAPKKKVCAPKKKKTCAPKKKKACAPKKKKCATPPSKKCKRPRSRSSCASRHTDASNNCSTPKKRKCRKPKPSPESSDKCAKRKNLVVSTEVVRKRTRLEPMQNEECQKKKARKSCVKKKPCRKKSPCKRNLRSSSRNRPEHCPTESGCDPLENKRRKKSTRFTIKSC